ncbi:MAG: DUF2461 domain-containing protein [Flavobacteriales bacterium]
MIFTKDILQFLQELEQNNNRDWFHSQKKRYTNSVKEPLKAFTQVLIDEALGEEGYLNQIEPKDCIFRINRDIRFSKDKSPYKSNLGVVISPKGKKDNTTPGMYIEISHKHLRLYSGIYTLNKDQLSSVREKIYENTAEFENLISDPVFKKNFGEVRGERNKRIPKPFSEIQESCPYILNKSFYYFKEYAAETILKTNVVEVLLKDYSKAESLNRFLFEPIQE